PFLPKIPQGLTTPQPEDPLEPPTPRLSKSRSDAMGKWSGEDVRDGSDEGAAGLAQSRHRPDADRGGLANQVPQSSKGVAQPGAKGSPPLREAIETLTRALARADGDCAALETAARQVAKAAESHSWDGAGKEEAITKEGLRQLIRDELTAAQKPAETKKSWAAVAATAATSSPAPQRRLTSQPWP